MSPTHSPALEQALAAYRAPGLCVRLRDLALPADVLFLVRIAAGEAQARELACAISGESQAVVVEAAVLFIQQAMFYPGSSSHRVLGVAPQAADSQIKEHHRWLVRWLHPDRNADEWDAVYADRVNHAWQDLRTPERRREYEALNLPATAAALWTPDPPARQVDRLAASRQPSDEFLLSTRTTRRLPMLILGGLTAGSFSVLGLQYYLTREETTRVIVAVESAEPAAITKRPETAQPYVAPPPLMTAPAPELAAPSIVALPPTRSAHSASPTPAPAPTVRKASRATPEIAVQAPAKAERPSVAAIAPHERSVTEASVPSVDIVAAPANAQPAAPVAPSLINETIAKQVILRFRSAYASGNINQVRLLFANESADQHDERKSILRSYGELFESSISRHIEIHNASWLTDGDTAILIASFEAWIVPRGEPQGRRVSGDIRFDLRSEDGELRIVRLRHDSVGG